MPFEVVFGLVIMFAAAIALWALYSYFAREKWNREGKGAEAKACSILKRYASLRNFKVLTGLRFETSSGHVEVQAALVGFFGVLILHTCGMRGEYYSDPTGKKWTIVYPDSRESFENPFLVQQRAVSAMREIFAKNKAYKIPIERATYISNRSKQTAVFFSTKEALIMPGRLRSYLDKEKFEQDANVDVAQIVSILEQYKQK